MTSYFAYDHGLPCRNPHCKSVGKPHPNCRCYGDHAEGGDAAFCSDSRRHNPGCEYFAEGGEAQPTGFIPDKDFVPADEEQDPEALPGFIPDDQFKEAPADESYSHVPGFIPDDQFVPHEDRYGTTGQIVGTALEGAAKGVAGPLATAAELGLSKLGVPGLSAEDQAGREAANPWTHGLGETAGVVGSLLSGVGEAGLIAKGAEAAANYTRLGKVGASILKGMLNNGVYQAGDEVSKWMLGQGDPQEPVGAAIAHTGIAALLGAGLGVAGSSGAGAAKKGLEKIAESKLGERAQYFLHGFAEASKTMTPELQEATDAGVKKLPEAARKGYKLGQKAFAALTSKITPATVGASAEGYQGWKENGLVGAVEGAATGAMHGIVANLAGKAIAGVASKTVTPVILKALSSNNIVGLLDALNHASNVAKGSRAINGAIEGLFSAAPGAGQKALNAYCSADQRDKIDDYISNGGIGQDIKDEVYHQNDQPAPEGYAKGGEVSRPGASPLHKDDDGVAIHYPEQNILMSAAKGRVSNYLTGLKPQPYQPKLAFDAEADTRQQKKTYHRALDIAAKPLGILEEIRKGTIEPEHIMHLNSMYPEVSSLLQKRMTERVIKAQMDGKKPTYKVRQGMSLFLGAALSSELKPENIQAAQAVFSAAKQQQPPNQPAKSSQKSTSTLTKADQAYLSGTQAREQRAQRS